MCIDFHRRHSIENKTISWKISLSCPLTKCKRDPYVKRTAIGNKSRSTDGSPSTPLPVLTSDSWHQSDHVTLITWPSKNVRIHKYLNECTITVDRRESASVAFWKFQDQFFTSSLQNKSTQWRIASKKKKRTKCWMTIELSATWHRWQCLLTEVLLERISDGQCLFDEAEIWG